ncbi:hypothetical protein, variant 1 [Aphanomyces invadans]|uniref:Uncharacterized protein n=1 Tax=Aphanomyces invadans TaxID=157072 RepID=A0A024TNU9_9STRA|nr:hypothetical protein, variant 1 [Aphanomyces invadans]ETV95815.1 hypothetical protein, variant 1 [Aphanomyces invadans]|eukprot:XP_008875566.1 hypothetical protein, variant 1 [Aphanomyces invadans]
MEADEAAWAECNDILAQVKQNNVHEGLRRLCALSLETSVASVREWTHATIADTLEWHESQHNDPPPFVVPSVTKASPSSLSIGVSLQSQHDVVKEYVLDQLQRHEQPLPHATSIALQHVLATDIDDTALFVELTNVFLCEHAILDMLASFEARVMSELSQLSLPARFNLWTQFPRVWERQIGTWLDQVHATPLLPVQCVILTSSSHDHKPNPVDDAASLFRTMYRQAPHLHVVALDVCQRYLAVYPTHRTLQLVQALAHCLTDRTVVRLVKVGGPLRGLEMPPPMTWWSLAQDADWIRSTCRRVLRYSPLPTCPINDGIRRDNNEEHVFHSWVASLTAVYALQCTRTHTVLHSYASALLDAIRRFSSTDAGPSGPVFAWLQQHREAAVAFAALTATLLFNWIGVASEQLPTGTSSSGRVAAAPPPTTLDAVVTEAMACMEYLLRLPPPSTMTRRAYQISLVGVVLASVECSAGRHNLCVHPTIAPALRELVRVMTVDAEVTLPSTWRAHAAARLTCLDCT